MGSYLPLEIMPSEMRPKNLLGLKIAFLSINLSKDLKKKEKVGILPKSRKKKDKPQKEGKSRKKQDTWRPAMFKMNRNYFSRVPRSSF